MSERYDFDSRAALDAALATHIAECLDRAITSDGCASLAVSGGSTPKGMFAALSQADIRWEAVYITLVDERWVSPDDPDANERLVREHLLQNRARAAKFVGLKSSAADAATGLRESTERFADVPLPLSCVVLGMGADGHTASWFPQAANLGELLDPHGSALLGWCDPVTAPHQRITLTLPVVLAAQEIILHITGEEKRDVLAGAARQRLPIAAVTDQDQHPVSIWWAP
jgi:6-phosphogluconolactonase